MEFPKCTIENKQRVISLRDARSKNSRAKLVLNNPNELLVKVVEIDGCVITEGIRCDNLVILPNNHLIYVEFKGNDVKHAIQQIEATIDYVSRVCNSSKKLKFTCIISCNRCPLSSSDIQKQKVLFKKKYQSELLIKPGEIQYDVEG